MNDPIIFAVDPGTTHSGFLVWDGVNVLEKGDCPNDDLFDVLLMYVKRTTRKVILVLEQICSYGMAVGAETFETVHWSGRFHQYWLIHDGGAVILLPRLQCKIHLCHNPQAKDANIRQALLDRFGPQGTKKNQGVLYGVSNHIWAALAVAVTAYDQLTQDKK